MITELDLANIFTHHPSKGTQVQRYEHIRSEGRNFAELIMDDCPESAEREIAIRKIQEAVMWANASIAINEK